MPLASPELSPVRRQAAAAVHAASMPAAAAQQRHTARPNTARSAKMACPLQFQAT